MDWGMAVDTGVQAAGRGRKASNDALRTKRTCATAAIADAAFTHKSDNQIAAARRSRQTRHSREPNFHEKTLYLRGELKLAASCRFLQSLGRGRIYFAFYPSEYATYR